MNVNTITEISCLLNIVPSKWSDENDFIFIAKYLKKNLKIG